ncbi:MAG: nuclear transport factor 2 family protein [Chthoniobacterales bacterium]
MNIKTLKSSIALRIVLTLACCALVSSAFAAGNDLQGVKAANAQFYSALNAMFAGNAVPMTNVWSHANDVAYLGPDGVFLVGWKPILADWKSQAAKKLGGKVTATNIHIITGKDLAVVQDIERGVNYSHGKPQVVSIRATNVFRLEDGKWKMVGHHTDKLPYLSK